MQVFNSDKQEFGGPRVAWAGFQREGMIHRQRHGAKQQYGMKLEVVYIFTAEWDMKKYKGWKDKEGADREESCLPHKQLGLNLLETQSH